MTVDSRCSLICLDLSNDQIGDEGLAALVAPGEGVLPKLEALFLAANRITDAGCTKLVTALDGGAMPAIGELYIVNELMSAAAQEAVHGARRRAIATRLATRQT